MVSSFPFVRNARARPRSSRTVMVASVREIVKRDDGSLTSATSSRIFLASSSLRKCAEGGGMRIDPPPPRPPRPPPPEREDPPPPLLLRPELASTQSGSNPTSRGNSLASRLSVQVPDSSGRVCAQSDAGNAAAAQRTH